MNDVIAWIFVTVNAARTLAYWPQIWAALKSCDGARSVSTITWGYFALSHFTGALYSLRVAHDSKLASMFCGNFAACAVLLGVVAWQRQRIAPAAALGAREVSASQLTVARS